MDIPSDKTGQQLYINNTVYGTVYLMNIHTRGMSEGGTAVYK